MTIINCIHLAQKEVARRLTQTTSLTLLSCYFLSFLSCDSAICSYMAWCHFWDGINIIQVSNLIVMSNHNQHYKASVQSQSTLQSECPITIYVTKRVSNHNLRYKVNAVQLWLSCNLTARQLYKGNNCKLQRSSSHYMLTELTLIRQAFSTVHCYIYL